jgi:hypothetical protein
MRKTKSWQLKFDDETYEKLRQALQAQGFSRPSQALEEITKNVLEAAERGELLMRPLTLRRRPRV